MPAKKPKKKRVAPEKEPKVVVIPRGGGFPPLRFLELEGKIKYSDILKAVEAVSAEKRKEKKKHVEP